MLTPMADANVPQSRAGYLFCDIIEARKDLTPTILKIDGIESDVLHRHVEMLFREGFIDGVEHGSMAHGLVVLVKDLSWTGHDFVASLKNDTVWNKIKSSIGTRFCKHPVGNYEEYWH